MNKEIELIDDILESISEYKPIEQMEEELISLRNKINKQIEQDDMRTFLKNYIHFKNKSLSGIRKIIIEDIWANNPDKAIDYGLVKIKKMTNPITGEVEKFPLLKDDGSTIFIDPIDNIEFHIDNGKIVYPFFP